MKYFLAILLVGYFTSNSQTNAKELLFVGGYFPAILEQHPDSSISGVAVDIIDEIMSHSSQAYQVAVIPWKRAQSMLQEGTADMLIGPYKTIERQRYIEYSRYPFYIDQMVLYTWKGSAIEWQGDFSALQHKLLGIPIGWTGGATFETARADLRIYEVPELTNGLEMLIRKRLDVVLSNRRNAIAVISDLKIDDKLTLLNPIVQPIKGYFGFSRQRDLTELKQLFEQQMAAMDADGTIKRFNQKHGLEYNNF